MMRRLLALALLLASPATAQTPGGFVPNTPLTAAALNSALSLKQDIGAIPSLSSPPAIGNTTPNTAAFSALSAATLGTTGAATLGGNTAITGTLGTTGAATFGGNTAVTGTLGSTGTASFGTGSTNHIDIAGSATNPIIAVAGTGNGAVIVRGLGTSGVNLSTTAGIIFQAVGAATAGDTFRVIQPATNATPVRIDTIGSGSLGIDFRVATQVNGPMFSLGGISAVGTKFKQYFISPFTMVADPTCVAGNTWWCTHVQPSGTITGGTDFALWEFIDNLQSTTNSAGILVQHMVAPNGGTAAGPRVALDILLSQVGSSQSGTITNTFISDALRATGFMRSNLGGTSTNYLGAMTAGNIACIMYATATFVRGCASIEFDLGSEAGSTYMRNTFAIFGQGNNNEKGKMGGAKGFVFANQVDSSIGLSRVLEVGCNQCNWPMDSYGGLFMIGRKRPAAADNVMAYGTDFGSVTYKAFSTRQPYRTTLPLRASGITGVTRLTTDGAAADGFILDSPMTGYGTGYTGNATATVTNCTGAVLNTWVETINGTIIETGVYTPGSACKAEATAAITGGGGSGATVNLLIAGNTLNFAINSSISVSCTLVADTFATSGTDSVSWNIVFGATMGATASTTAIIGSPTWTLISETTGAAAKFSGSKPAAPTADTTLGAVNLSITPTTGTWNVGGTCEQNRSAQL